MDVGDGRSAEVSRSEENWTAAAAAKGVWRTSVGQGEAGAAAAAGARGAGTTGKVRGAAGSTGRERASATTLSAPAKCRISVVNSEMYDKCRV